MTMLVPLRMHVPGLLMNPLAVPLAMLVPLRMQVPGLLMNPLAVPLALLVPLRMHIPGPLVNPLVPLAFMVPLRMHVPGLLANPLALPLASMVRRAVIPSRVAMMGGELTAVEGSQHRGDADRGQAVVPLAGCRTDQSADDATHDRSLPRPCVIGPNGCRRHGRAEHDGSRERNSSDEALFPTLNHRHPPILIASLCSGAPSY
jgi:hypothetical protein